MENKKENPPGWKSAEYPVEGGAIRVHYHDGFINGILLGDGHEPPFHFHEEAEKLEEATKDDYGK